LFLSFLSWSSTPQSVSKTNFPSSSSSTWFLHLWFKQLLQWATSFLVFLILKQLQSHSPQSWTFL
jgi:hypothetical protein